MMCETLTGCRRHMRSIIKYVEDQRTSMSPTGLTSRISVGEKVPSLRPSLMVSERSSRRRYDPLNQPASFLDLPTVSPSSPYSEKVQSTSESSSKSLINSSEPSTCSRGAESAGMTFVSRFNPALTHKLTICGKHLWSLISMLKRSRALGGT